MNHAMKAAFAGLRSPSRSAGAVSFFHSTPVSERKRRTHWNSGTDSYRSKKFNYYAKRIRRMDSKRTLLRDVSEYAEYLFQSWRDKDERNNFSSNDGTSWFRRQYWSKGAKLNGFSSHETQWGRCKNRKGGVEISSSDDDEEVETIFRSAFGGGKYYYWSFNSSENSRWRNSSSQANYKSSWNWRYETDEEADISSQSELASERLALGLNAFGPLRLEEVKSAYRACALRWHPDRHQGSSKVAAEEKFKHCSVAYKLLCEKLGAN